MFKKPFGASLALLLAGPAAAADEGKRGTYVPDRQPSYDDRDRNRSGDGDRDHDRDGDHDRGRIAIVTMTAIGATTVTTIAAVDEVTTTIATMTAATGAITTATTMTTTTGVATMARDAGGIRWLATTTAGVTIAGTTTAWRHFPPSRYQLDFGYRSGYELAWRDWLNHGRNNRYWRRSSFYGYGIGYTYRSGYEAGWRDAALYYGRGYRPDYWSYDPRGGWFFSFSHRQADG